MRSSSTPPNMEALHHLIQDEAMRHESQLGSRRHYALHRTLARLALLSDEDFDQAIRLFEGILKSLHEKSEDKSPGENRNIQDQRNALLHPQSAHPQTISSAGRVGRA